MPDWFGNKESGDVVAKPPKTHKKDPNYSGKHRDETPRRVKVIYTSPSPTAPIDNKNFTDK